jgi:hypothetical protein
VTFNLKERDLNPNSLAALYQICPLVFRQVYK